MLLLLFQAPWASSLSVEAKTGLITAVGQAEGAAAAAAAAAGTNTDVKVVDLQGSFVMPVRNFLDTHLEL
jgi:predicted amidohydrolase YtcJ